MSYGNGSSRPTEVPRTQYDLLVKLLGCNVLGAQDFRPEFDRIREISDDWLRMLRTMNRECLRRRALGWSEHEQVLYLALRRGLLLGEAQMRWLTEVDVYLIRGELPD